MRREQEEELQKKELKARALPKTPKARPLSMYAGFKTPATSRLQQDSTDEIQAAGGEGKENRIANTGLKRSNTGTSTLGRSTPKRENTGGQRFSMVLAGKSERANAGSSETPKRSSVVFSTPFSATSTSARPSSIVMPKRSSLLMTAQPSASTSRSTSADSRSRQANIASSTSGIVLPSKSILTAEDAALQRQKAREIYHRDQAENESKVRERREKEEAAKRARLEAAEKGRQSSREWAEKQKKRLMEARLVRTQQDATTIAPVG